MATLTPASVLTSARRVVVKIGSALLVEQGQLRAAWLAALAGDVAALRAAGAEVVIVSSGSIALGRAGAGPAPRRAGAGTKPGGRRRGADSIGPRL